MKEIITLLVLGFLAEAGLAQDHSERIYSPAEVVVATKELDGKEIAVSGWIGGCAVDDDRFCRLYSNHDAARGHESREWPLPIALPRDQHWHGVRKVIARGKYIITCTNSPTTICVDDNGFFQAASIEDK